MSTGVADRPNTLTVIQPAGHWSMQSRCIDEGSEKLDKSPRQHFKQSPITFGVKLINYWRSTWLSLRLCTNTIHYFPGGHTFMQKCTVMCWIIAWSCSIWLWLVTLLDEDICLMPFCYANCFHISKDFLFSLWHFWNWSCNMWGSPNCYRFVRENLSKRL